ncbi:hypothetical protein C8Q74DRAFT_1255428 [Fomes fomentarius]|nr:hypothetical protein C8Q74DRAFT_1255428 [Fomes fomentarius]
MAPRPREAPPAPGLLASAFSFVSREIESFITTATGGEIQQPRPEASSSRVTLDGKRKKRDERGEGRSEKERERERRATKRVRKRSEVETERARARRKLREDVDDERAPKVVKKKSLPDVRREREREQERERSSEREAADDEDGESALGHLDVRIEQNRVPDEIPVKPLPRSLKKRRETAAKDVQRHPEPHVVEEPKPQPQVKRSTKDTPDAAKFMPPPPNLMPLPPTPLTKRTAVPASPFPTMPGSLFPRSESLIPEAIPARYKRAVPRPRTPSPPPPSTTVAESSDAAEDAIGSQPTESPLRGRSHDRTRENSVDSRRSVGASSVRESSQHSEVSAPAESNTRRSFDGPLNPTARPRSSKGKERAYDTSGDVRVRGKEQELRQAREEQARNANERDDIERERDKVRIKMLEEEVTRLRAELASKSSSRSSMMPPPPPPPPPPLFRPHVPTTTSGDTSNYLASARAGLKPTAPPVEAPINSVAYGGARARKTGQPTFNMPSDKMAAFLREMKSVRLRKVSGPAGSMGPPLFPPSAAGDVAGEPSRSSGSGMSEARRAAILGDMSFDTGVAARIFIGEKRKRDALEEAAAGPPKRRETTFLRSDRTGEPTSAASSQSSSSQSSATSSQSSASSSQSSASTSMSRTSPFDVSVSRSQTSRSRGNGPLRIWPTRSTETDVTTPSLCSDNENDHSEDKPPDTPSDVGRGANNNVLSVQPRERQPQEEPEIIDVDALETPPRHERSASPIVEAEARKDAFARRPPASALPLKSPVKPIPPARAKTKTLAPSKLPLPRRVPVPIPPPPEEAGSDSDDPLLMEGRGRVRSLAERPREANPVAGPSRVPGDRSESTSGRSRSQSQSQSHSVALPTADAEQPESRPRSRLSNHARRRLTLDEEMRRAGDSLWRDSSEEPKRPPSPPQADLDSGQLVALGTKSSKRGFLARGGGAGAPVFMGEGYVQGASAEDELVDGDARRSRSVTAGAGRTSRAVKRR